MSNYTPVETAQKKAKKIVKLSTYGIKDCSGHKDGDVVCHKEWLINDIATALTQARAEERETIIQIIKDYDDVTESDLAEGAGDFLVLHLQKIVTAIRAGEQVRTDKEFPNDSTSRL